MTALSWGRRYLMCPPQHFGVLYEINPWMHREVPVDRDKSREEWERLVANLRSAGAEVVTMAPEPHVPDLVFTANAGVVNGRRFVPSHFRHRERQPETPVFATWFEAAGYDVVNLPESVVHEGAGDALPFGAALLSGYRTRSDAAAGPLLSERLGVPVRSLELTDPRLYHFDLTFCPLDDRRALCAAGGWDGYGRRVVEAVVPQPLWLEPVEALAFCANSVVVGTSVVMPAVPPRVGRRLEAWGFEVVESPVPEFVKAGGGCRCLTLALDVSLQSPGPPTVAR
ncbi:MAG: dimethylarginine dimethylaminohydrolase family protein [Acidimicrobiia bacterium]